LAHGWIKSGGARLDAHATVYAVAGFRADYASCGKAFWRGGVVYAGDFSVYSGNCQTLTANNPQATLDEV
jgi:hypothetical protein